MSVVKFDSPETYLKAREQLISSERALRRDAPWIAKASQEETRAEEYIRAIRKYEAANIWAVEREDIPNIFPGMGFLTAKSVIEDTKLFKLITKMPKGALLHCHIDATVNTRTLLGFALKHDALHIRVEAKITSHSMKSLLPQFKAFSTPQASPDQSLASESYQLGSWIPLKQARELFPSELGGTRGFDDWVVGGLMINPSEAYVTHNSVRKIWDKFSSTFVIGAGLTRYSPIWADYIRELFLSSIDDGISYVEARVSFLYKVGISADGQENVPHREYLRVFDQVLSEVKAELKSQGREDDFIGARIIYTTLRFVSEEELEWWLDDCIALKTEFPQLIAGFDLVGPEDGLYPLKYYLKTLLRFRERVEALGLDIPFLFHAGETLGDGSPEDQNLYDAILLGTKRIGHGFSIQKHPQLMDICRERGILLEVCPISNEILRFTSSMPTHPLPVFLNNGVPVSLSSDDPAVFGNMGLSFDFFQVLVASHITGLITLGTLARDSIKFSTLDETTKQRALDAWERKWSKYVQELAQEATASSLLLQ